MFGSSRFACIILALLAHLEHDLMLRCTSSTPYSAAVYYIPENTGTSEQSVGTPGTPESSVRLVIDTPGTQEDPVLLAVHDFIHPHGKESGRR